MIYRSLNIHPKKFTYNKNPNKHNKVLLFLAGMRGSGKTSELAKISKKLHKPEAFFCVTCNLDEGLDLNDMEYMDILIFQLERLLEELNKKTGLKFEDSVIRSMQEWFQERVKEINKSIKKDGGLELVIKAGTPSILSFFNFTSKFKTNLSGSKENVTKIRSVIQNNFTDFAIKFNEFIEYINTVLRNGNISQEILFIVDGLEKVATTSIRSRIIIHEQSKIRLIKANTIFTLPIELMQERQRLISFSTVASFPFVKIKEKNGTLVEAAIQKFTEFVYKRIDKNLFESEEIVRKAVLFGGGSPRELLRILEYAYLYTDEDNRKITMTSMNTGIRKLAAETSQFLSDSDLKQLKILKENNEKDDPTPFNEIWQDLLEKLIIMEYNDGTYKRVNPIIEESELYKRYVG